MTYGLGRRPLPKDERDFSVRRIPQLQETTTTRKFWSMGGPDMRLDQGQTGTCQGQAWTNWLIAGPITHPDFPAFSDADTAEAFARQLYLDATGDATLEQGAYTRQILKVLTQRTWIGAYYRCSSVDEIVQTILTVGPVCHGSSWFNSMFDPVSEYENSYLRVDEASGVAGGHEYLLSAVNLAPAEGPPYVRVENSWGGSWAHNGCARISIDDLRVLFVGDAYVCSESVF
ncbi:MAG: hypothetical protein M3P43_13325 [Actinomycetota bacterium]|nr:hypothetical protein [Actinomycetota bacterium]